MRRKERSGMNGEQDGADFSLPQVRFVFGGARVSLPVAQVLGVSLPHNPVRLPGAPPQVAGLSLWEGRIVPVLVASSGVRADAARFVFVRDAEQMVALWAESVAGVGEPSEVWPTFALAPWLVPTVANTPAA